MLADSSGLQLLAEFDSSNIRNISLALGLGGIACGIILFINHKRHLKNVLAGRPEQRIVAYEERKFRRRSIVSAMIASTGLMMAALHWVNDAKIFAVFIMMILGLLVAILGVALIDLLSVSLQQIATPDDQAQKAMVKEYLRQREKAAEQNNEKGEG